MSRSLNETPNLRWFSQYRSCGRCGKRSDGLLMGGRNESYGDHCLRCADRRLKESKAVREMRYLRIETGFGAPQFPPRTWSKAAHEAAAEALARLSDCVMAFNRRCEQRRALKAMRDRWNS